MSLQSSVPRTAVIRSYLLPQSLLDLEGPSSMTEKLGPISAPSLILTHLKLLWVMKLHCVGQEFDNKLCDISPYMRGLLQILMRESVKLPNEFCMNYHYSSVSIKADLDVLLDYFLDNFESTFSASCKFFIPLVQRRTVESCISTSAREMGYPRKLSTFRLQEVIDDILTVHTLRNGWGIETLYNDLRTLKLGIPYLIRLSISQRDESKILRGLDPKKPLKAVRGLTKWLNAKSNVSRDLYESEALLNFIHLAVLIETDAIVVTQQPFISVIRKALRHHNTFPYEIRRRIMNFLLNSPATDCDLAVSLRTDSRINLDIPVFMPKKLLNAAFR